MNNIQDEIKSLLSDLHGSLNSLLENKISLDEANDLFRNFRERSDLIKKEASPDKVDFIKEILFSHNINNFSRLTFIYTKKTDSLELEQFAGESSFIDGLNEFIDKSGYEITENPIPGDEKVQAHIYTISIEMKNFTLIFGTVTSSKLFNKSRFLMISDIIRKIFEKQISATNPYLIDYYNLRSGNATEYILKKILNGFELSAHVYIFVKIYEIYSHSGRKNLESLSNNILETIKKNYTEASIHLLSGGIFLVLLDRDDQLQSKMPRIEFVYNNFPIIYNKINIDIQRESDIYKFWENLYSFRHYILTGDQ